MLYAKTSYRKLYFRFISPARIIYSSCPLLMLQRRKHLGGRAPTFPDSRLRRRPTDTHTLFPLLHARIYMTQLCSGGPHSTSARAHLVTYFYLHCLSYIIGIHAARAPGFRFCLSVSLFLSPVPVP